MRIAIGADHAGFETKEKLKASLAKAGHEVRDLGTSSLDSVDYPDYAARVGKAVASGEAERGVLVCGSGIGMSIAANKVPGVRAALLGDEFSAEVCRRHNDANVACFGARLFAPEAIQRFLDKFLATPFEGGRHQARVNKMKSLEANQ